MEKEITNIPPIDEKPTHQEVQNLYQEQLREAYINCLDDKLHDGSHKVPVRPGAE